MYRVDETIDIDLPASVIYRHLSAFEDFPDFIEGVEEVRWLEADRMRWRTAVAGQTQEWELRIIERAPHEQIAWESVSGATAAGKITLVPLDECSTRLHLEMEFASDGAAPRDEAPTRSGTLRHFKRFVESRPAASPSTTASRVAPAMA